MSARLRVALLALGWITLAGLDDPSSVERGVLAELNRIRADPQGYAEELAEYRRGFEGKVALLSDGSELMTTEGPPAVDEAIAFLRWQKPAGPLAPSHVLAKAAQSFAGEQARSGAVGHRSADGALPPDRVKRAGGDIYVAETIAYGPSKARDIARQFIVDDGVRGRGHRALVFRDEYHFAGVGCGPHPVWRYMCVVDYAATPEGRPQLPVKK